MLYVGRGRARGTGAYAGTAGEMLDFCEALGVRSLMSSFSRRFFSVDVMRLEAITVRIRHRSFNHLDI